MHQRRFTTEQKGQKEEKDGKLCLFLNLSVTWWWDRNCQQREVTTTNTFTDFDERCFYFQNQATQRETERDIQGQISRSPSSTDQSKSMEVFQKKTKRMVWWTDEETKSLEELAKKLGYFQKPQKFGEKSAIVRKILEEGEKDPILAERFSEKPTIQAVFRKLHRIKEDKASSCGKQKKYGRRPWSQKELDAFNEAVKDVKPKNSANNVDNVANPGSREFWNTFKESELGKALSERTPDQCVRKWSGLNRIY